MNGDGKKGLDDYLNEAQEFAEDLSRVLMDMDTALKNGEDIDPDLLNEAFRCWHTLKGLSATFAVEPLCALAHRQETMLDELRMGRLGFSDDVLDTLLSSVELVLTSLATLKETGRISQLPMPDDGPLLVTPVDTDIPATVTASPQTTSESPVTATSDKSGVPQDILEVLTEFEEHRLNVNLERQRPLYQVRAAFSLASIDTELESIKGMLKPLGEIITYLPCDDGDDLDKLNIAILVALKANVEDLTHQLADVDVTVQPLMTADRQMPSIHPDDSHPEVVADRQMVDRPQKNTVIKKSDKDRAISLRSVSQTVRVDISKLDGLMNTVGELGLVRSSIGRITDELRAAGGRTDLAIELHRIVRGFERRLVEIRNGILEVRMVPVGRMFERLARVIRRVSRNLHKEIRFSVSGEETEVDKLIIEELSDPMMHIIRNAIDHGIEVADDRIAAGKPEAGTVALNAYQKGNHVIIEVEDDGRGIDVERVVTKAIDAGEITPLQAETMAPQDLTNLIFLPGISTARETTDISGRGVGMDVVKTNISALGGIVEVQSELGIGTKFTITMPVTLAIIPALLFRVEGVTYAIPLNTVAEALMLNRKDIRSVMNTDTMVLRGQTLPLCRLDVFFNIFRPGPIPENSRVVVAELGQRKLGLVVDALLGQQDIIIKPVGPSLARAGCFSGVTDLGNQTLALVIDTVAVIEEFFDTNDEKQHAG